MDKQLIAAQDKTVQTLISGSKRKKNVPIRNDFVQSGTSKNPSPGLLGKLIRTSNGRSLDLYLLHRLVASAAPWDTKREAAVWARALGLGDEAYGRDAVSKCWKKLESLQLISRERESKMAKITSLHEDGSLKPYAAPTGNYFTLPLEYWVDEWYRRLSYPGKAVLLISSSRAPGFYLPGSKANKWYGISADTLLAGFAELTDYGALTYEDRTIEDYSRAKVTYLQRHYTLIDVFAKSPSQTPLAQPLSRESSLQPWKRGELREEVPG